MTTDREASGSGRAALGGVGGGHRHGLAPTGTLRVCGGSWQNAWVSLGPGGGGGGMLGRAQARHRELPAVLLQTKNPGIGGVDVGHSGFVWGRRRCGTAGQPLCRLVWQGEALAGAKQLSHAAAQSGARHRAAQRGLCPQATAGLVASRGWQKSEGGCRVGLCPSTGWHLPCVSLQHKGCVPFPRHPWEQRGAGGCGSLPSCPRPQLAAGTWGTRRAVSGSTGTPILPGPRAHSRQKLLAHGECVPGSPALSHLVFIVFLKSLLLRGGCLVRGGGNRPGPHCSLCSVALTVLARTKGWADRLRGAGCVWTKGPPHRPTPQKCTWVPGGFTGCSGASQLAVGLRATPQ